MFHCRANGFLLFWSLTVWCVFFFRSEMVCVSLPATQILTNGWQLARVPDITQTGSQISSVNFNASAWMNAVVPGTALTSYQDAGLIADPYYGTNMAAFESMDGTPGVDGSGYYDVDYWFRDTFIVPAGYAGQSIWLNFDAINWMADIYVNGTYVGTVNSPFLRGKFDITSLATPGGTNCVAVRLYWCDGLVYNSPDFIGVDGWDFMPHIADRDVGIYQNVYLSASGSVRIVDPFVITTLPLPATSPANVTLSVGLTNSNPVTFRGTLSGTISPDGISFQTNLTINAGSVTNFTFSPGMFPQLSITNPALWWPNGYGPQNLHNLQLTFQTAGSTSDSQTVTFGIRQYTYDTSGTDQNMQVYCNGQRIMCKGGCWGMPDAMLKYTDAQLDTAVRLHKEMNFTMIRCWHGTSDLQAFYDDCDKYGIMVWDEFWLNGSNFGLGPTNTANFIAASIDKYKRLRNHPSLAVWCGENEAVPPSNLLLPQDYTNYDNTRIYIDASNAGPIHGGVTYAVQDPAWYFGAAYGFTTEIGLPSIPPLESMQAMMPASSLWPLGDTNWVLHDWRTDIGNKGLPQYTNAIATRYGPASDITNFCMKAQLLNYESYRAIFEAWNEKLWNDCSGVLLWMSQPAWPSTIWQTYDWYFSCGGAYFGCKKACEPIHIQWDCANGDVKVINNTLQPLSNLAADVQVYNMDGTLQFGTNIAGINVSADSAALCFGLFNNASLALNRPAYASSIDNSSDAVSNAVDGNLTTRWSSAYSDPQWFYVDLGSVYSFDTVTILWETAYAKAFQIQISNDANTWTTVWSTNNLTLSSSGGWSTSTFPQASGRYVRMYGTQRATGWGYSVFEFEVFQSGSANAWMNNLSSVHFIKLKLTDGTGALLSDNFYWRGYSPLDYSALASLPKVNPAGTSTSVTDGTNTFMTVVLTNSSSGVAFATTLELIHSHSGQRVLPVFYSDNYFSMLPHESRTVTLESSNTNFTVPGDVPQLKFQGWNIPPSSVVPVTLSAPVVSPSNSVFTGTVVTLVCSNFAGVPPYSFQWQASGGGINFTNVDGATTNALVLSNVTATDAGYYQLAFTAGGLSVTSLVAQLTVNALPVICAQKAGGSLILNWPQGALLEATNLNGPWTTKIVSPPYTNPLESSQMFYKLLLQ
jgi:hypothetical protein